MAWQFVLDGQNKEWAVDVDAMYALVRANVRAVETRKRATVKRTSEGFWAPTIASVEIDYTGLREFVDTESKRWWADTTKRLAALPGEQVVQDLTLLRQETDAKTRDLEKIQRAAMAETQKEIEGVVSAGENAVEVLQVVRDVCATTLVAGATVLSGGAALAALGAGAGLKSASKYQDTGNVGAAVIEGTSTMVIGMIGIAGKGVQVASDKRVLLIVGSALDGAFDGTKALIDGQSGAVALEVAVAKFGLSVAGGALPIDKLANWQQLVINTAVGVATDKATGAIPPKPKGLPPTPPAPKALSFASSADAAFVLNRVLRPAASIPR
jgi:hypothetical protein